MTELKITHNGEEYIIPQNVIDDLMKFHGRDAVKEVEEMLKRNDEVKMTELTPEQKDFLNLFYQKIKQSIKENKVDYDPITFKPFKKIVLEIDLEFICDNSFYIPKEKLYEVIGKVICGVEKE
jgi:hypothetical protein